jgi:hypothetical protein
MAFKMKNAALKKQADMAACPRAATKMQAESAMKAMSKSPAEMETPAKAMTKSPAEFNAKLRAAKKAGKLNPEFAAVVKKKDDEMKRLLEIKRNTNPNDLDAMEAINKRIRAHARKRGAKNVPDEETGGDRKPKKKAPLEMESPMKEMDPASKRAVVEKKSSAYGTSGGYESTEFVKGGRKGDKVHKSTEYKKREAATDGTTPETYTKTKRRKTRSGETKATTKQISKKKYERQVARKKKRAERRGDDTESYNN